MPSSFVRLKYAILWYIKIGKRINVLIGPIGMQHNLEYNNYIAEHNTSNILFSLLDCRYFFFISDMKLIRLPFWYFDIIAYFDRFNKNGITLVILHLYIHLFLSTLTWRHTLSIVLFCIILPLHGDLPWQA